MNVIVLQSNANFTFDEDQILEEIKSAYLLTKVRGKWDSINWKAAHNYYMYRCRWALLADPSKKIFNKTRDQIKERFRRLKEKERKRNNTKFSRNAQQSIFNHLITNANENNSI